VALGDPGRRGGPLERDVTYVDGEVVGKEMESAYGVPVVTVRVILTNQDGGVLVEGEAEVGMPL